MFAKSVGVNAITLPLLLRIYLFGDKSPLYRNLLNCGVLKNLLYCLAKIEKV